MATVVQLVETTLGKVTLFHYHLLAFDDYFMMTNRLEKLEKKLDIYYSDETIISLPYTLLAILERSRQVQQDLIFPPNIDYLYETQEYLEITRLFWDYSFLRDTDVMYLTLQVLSANVIESTFVDEHMTEIEGMIDQLIASLETRLAIKFKHKTALHQLLLQHIKPALFRNYIGAHVINPLTDQFMQEYDSFFQLVKAELKRFDFLTKQEMNNDEASFIAMIILGFMVDHANSQNNQPFSAIVVCQSGTSISQLLLNNLQELFPQINFTQVLSFRQSGTFLPPVDFIFSTIPLSTEQPTLLVKTLMTVEEKTQLVKEVQTFIDQDKQKVTKALLAQLSEIIPQGRHHEAAERLEQYFEEKENVVDTQELSPLQSASQIEFIDEQWNLSEVTRHLLTKMYLRHSISENYCHKCLENVIGYHETMILAPKVLLPHASFEDGVYQMDVQIGLLRTPISINNEKYQMIIALAPGQHNQHVNWLVNMNELLLTHFSRIINCQTAEEVYALLEGDADGI